jgi:hypothetical protein
VLVNSDIYIHQDIFLRHDFTALYAEGAVWWQAEAQFAWLTLLVKIPLLIWFPCACMVASQLHPPIIIVHVLQHIHVRVLVCCCWLVMAGATPT